MSEDEKLDWGRRELAERQADVAAVKSGDITLAEAQKRARSRSRKSGMTPHESFSWMNEAARQSRRVSA